MPNLGDEWRPDRAGFVMHIADGGTRLNIEVDPINPQAWRQVPYYAAFKQWAAQGSQRGLVLVAWMGRRCFEITPTGDIDHGMVRPTTKQRSKSRGIPVRA